MGRIKQAFTLIEMIVVVGVIGLVLPLLFSIIFLLIQQQIKLIRVQEVKKQGDLIINLIETTIRNSAVAVYSDSSLTNIECSSEETSYPVSYPSSPSSGNNVYFKDKFGNWFNYSLNLTNISSNSATTNFNLNNDRTMISDFRIQCRRINRYAYPVIYISFTIDYNPPSTKSEERAAMSYQTRIKLRTED